MTITSLSIQNLGPHADATFQFSPGHNLIVGPNGSGKSTVLRAISLALTGTCHLTDKRGKGFDRLIRDGETEAVIEITLEPHGTITRTRSARKHKLLLSWADGDKVSDNETRLLDALQLPAETIWAMFDPIPVLERSIEDQRAVVLRVLRPAKITVPKSLIDAGIPKISGIEHIESLRKDHKEGILRDLNRDAKTLDEHPPEEAGDEPKGVNLDERLKLLDGLNAKHRALTTELQTVSSAIGTFEERIRRAESAGPKPTEEQAAELLAAITGNAETLKASRETEQTIAETVQKANETIQHFDATIRANKERERAILNRLAEIDKRPKIECPADACPLIKQLAELADADRKALTSEQAEITATLESLDASAESARASLTRRREQLESAYAVRQSLEEKSAELRGLQSDAERIAKAHEEANVARNSLVEAVERRDKINSDIEKCQQLRDKNTEAVNAYSEWKARADAVRKWREQVAAKAAAIDRERQIVDDLIELRKSMIGGRLEQFLGIMAGFLEPFGIEGVEYTFDGGFVCIDRGADLLSDGQKAMMFEAAFKVAVATVTGVGIVAVDDLAPMTEDFRFLIIEGLAESGHQVIQCVVDDTTDEWNAVLGATVFYLSDGAAKLVSPAA